MVRTFVARYNQTNCDAVRSQACEVKRALDACWQCSCSHQASLDLNWHTNRPTKSPVFSLSLSYDITKNPSSTRILQWRKTQVKVDTPTVSSRSGDYGQVLGPPLTDIQLLTVAPSQSTSVRQQPRSLFQWRPRSRSTSPLPPSPGNPKSANSLIDSVKRINSLCQFVRGQDNGGEPVRFLPVPGGPKRVYLKTIPGSRTEEATLVHLLPPSEPPDHLKLSRRKRLEIAASAAWATLLLCETPWLNRTWDKHGLCFFSENVSAAGSSLAGRCVSITQSCTSKSQPANDLLDPQPAHDLGIHPHHNTVVRNEAIFALGVLLIELCLNRSFEDWKRIMNIDTTSTSIIDDYSVAESLIEDVFDEGGEPYGNAVQRCIRFAFPGRDTTKNFSHATFRRDFHNLVVAPIEATLSTAPL